MTATTPLPSLPRSAQGTPLLRTLRLGLRRIRYEVRGYFRQGDSVFFTFLFPVVFLLIFSVAFSTTDFGKDATGHVVSAAQYYLPGMLAAGLLLTGTQNMAVEIAGERSDGTLKRLGGSPLPVFSYLIGKMGEVLVSALLQAALLLLVARLLFQVPLPDTSAAWVTFGWVFLLGAATFAVLGIALSVLPRSGKSATAVVIPITLVLQFVSGVYLPFAQLPTWLQQVAGFFPVKWVAQGMRSVFLPEGFGAAEPGGSWDLAAVAAVTAVWLVVGLVLCRVTFRWIRRDT